MAALALLADIHGNMLALAAVVADIRRREITTVANLGDHVSGPLWPEQTIAFVMQQPWVQIAGNCDRCVVQQPPALQGASDRYASERLSAAQLEWLGTLPASAWLTPEILLCHGTPLDDMVYLLETVAHGRAHLAHPDEIMARLGSVNARVVVCAHSHVPRLVQLPDGTLLINPGSVGVQAYDNTDPEPYVMETGSPHARYALLAQQGEDWQVEFITVPYDHLAAAQQARANGRSDWEVALRTGYAGL